MPQNILQISWTHEADGQLTMHPEKFIVQRGWRNDPMNGPIDKWVDITEVDGIERSTHITQEQWEGVKLPDDASQLAKFGAWIYIKTVSGTGEFNRSDALEVKQPPRIAEPVINKPKGLKAEWITVHS